MESERKDWQGNRKESALSSIHVFDPLVVNYLNLVSEIVYSEGVIEEFSHRDYGTSQTIPLFVVVDCDDEAQTQRQHLRSCMDAASGMCSPETAAID